jgi:CheY-like chemotaxis protein/DNA-binding CsgD family transcriptional regulator
MSPGKIDRSGADVVLIVDDIPENLSLLHDALEESGYAVLVATNGESALQSARQGVPDIVLLDAMMPGMDGFEVSRRLKADYSTQHIPIIFMTGLTETEHVVAAFAAGGVDYVTKPIRPREVLARIAAHLKSARQMHQARNALDAFGQATLAVTLPAGRIVWQTTLTRKLLGDYFHGTDRELPVRIRTWLEQAVAAARSDARPLPLNIIRGARKLILSLHLQTDKAQEDTPEEEWVVVLREESDASIAEALMMAFKLTQREAEVFYWVIKGKTNRDIGDILGTSPRTVDKHLQHIFEKLGIETRTAAVALAMNKVRAVVPTEV